MDNTVKVWDVDTGTCLHTLTGHTSLVGLLANSPNYIVSAAADASLRIWDANSHDLKHILGAHGGAITCFAHDETKVVSGSDGSLKLWDIRTGKFVRDLVAGINSVWQVVFRDNVLVAATNRGGNTVFEVFDFGGPEHPSGIDDESLDDLRGPPWKRGNPLEPQTYQVDEVDDYFNFSDPSASEFDAAMMPSSPFRSEQAREVTHDDLDEGSSRRGFSGSRNGVGASGLGSGSGSGSRSRRSTRLADRDPRSARRVAGSSSLGSSGGGTTRSRESRAATIGSATNASASASASASTWNGTMSGGLSAGEASSSSSRLSRIQEYRDFRAAREQGSRTPRARSGVYHEDVGVAESAVDDDDEERGVQHPGESFAPIFDEPMDERDEPDERDEAETYELEEEDEEEV
jgi:F-box and WD-40 domain protein CDC4